MRTSRSLTMAPIAAAVIGLAALLASDEGAAARTVGDGARGEPVVGAQANAEAHPDRLVVRFREGVAPGQVKKALDDLGATVKKEHGRSKLRVIQLAGGADLAAAIEALEGSGLVEVAALDYVVSAFDAPNDPGYDGQWHLHDTAGGMWAEGAWDLATNRGAGVTVAVIDTGVAFETYTGGTILWEPQQFAPAPDLAGVPIVAPWNFLANNAHANDDHGHGTHVSGTVLQTTDNGRGGAGVASEASLMPVKVLDYSGNGSAADLVEAIYYAVDNGARVINMSLGFGGTGDPDAYGQVCSEIAGLADALDYAFAEGVTVVAAAGNEGATKVACPAAYHTVVSVGATRYDGQVTYYSNTGFALDITAPGGDPNVDEDGNGSPDGVLQETFCADPFTLLITGDYSDFCAVYMPGTSMASPHAAGAAALLLGENPSLSPLQVRYYLETTARDRGAAGRDDAYGWGALDARAAIAALQSGPPPVIAPTPPPPPPPGSGPAAPTALLATATSATSISISWQDNATDESGYKVERRLSGGSFSQVATLSANATGYTSANLAAGTSYDFRVRAYGSSGDSYYSNIATTSTLPPPSPPGDLVATALGPTSVALAWTDNSSSETGFRVERSTNGTTFQYVTTTGANATRYTSLYLTPDTPYWFRVRANEGTIYSAWSNVATATTAPPPAAPTGLVATPSGATAIQLAWNDNATTETAYRVERSTNGTSFLQIAQLPAGATGYTSIYLAAGTTYWYRVRAAEGTATSGYSNVASATTLSGPAAPSNLVAAPASQTSIQLTWTDNSGAESGFKIERSSDGVTFTQIATTVANATTYTNSWLTPGAQYWYRVRAYEGSVNGAYSEVAQGSTVPPPAAPSDLTATALSVSSIRLAWTDNTSAESGFRVERSLDGSSWLQVTTLAANTLTWTNTSLVAGTTYYYRIRAYEGTINGAWSNVAAGATFSPPQAPSDLTATALSTTSIRLAWTDNSASEAGFRIERSADAGATWASAGTVGANVVTWTNNYLAAGTTYQFRVRAYEGSANGPYSNTAAATTFPPPAAPSGLTAELATATSIRLTWTDNATTETGFRVERSTNGGTSWQLVGVLGANVTTWTNGSVTAGTTYFYRVRAVDVSVYSAWSNTVTITP